MIMVSFFTWEWESTSFLFAQPFLPGLTLMFSILRINVCSVWYSGSSVKEGKKDERMKEKMK